VQLEAVLVRDLVALMERGARCVLEIGPGAMLAKLWNTRFPMWPARSLDEFRDPARALEWVRDSLA
jgi:[acyl-carrier-protein] S-malonyltransferase